MVSLSPNIGKIAGITIQLHWTFLLLIFLAFILLATSSQGLYLFSLIILLFVCVLIHELAHSLVSKRNGIGVKKIVLLPIGGASVINLDEVKPKIEFKIALAGPLMSILIGIICGALFVYAPTGLVKQALFFLFEINILLGLFNLLPGFPLDGGRVLRSYLQRKHSFIKSTQLAVGVSKWVVVALVIGTVVYAAVIPNATFTYREFIVFWDFIIALFLYDGAKAELQSAEVKEYTSKITSGSMISKNFVMAKSGMQTKYLYRLLLEKGTRIVLFRKGSKVYSIRNPQLGMLIRDSDVIKKSDVHLFNVEIPQISSNEKLSKAIETMRNDELNTLVVMKGRQIAGILNAQYLDSALDVYLSKKKGRFR
ncbi:MAG TPA: site-2 protease family protein [Candidatus Acidoferrum sp.]|nr:site-2 protease family protein [Candidatus Acidoferrum sp.]